MINLLKVVNEQKHYQVDSKQAWKAQALKAETRMMVLENEIALLKAKNRKLKAKNLKWQTKYVQLVRRFDLIVLNV